METQNKGLSGFHATLMESVSNSLLRNVHIGKLLEVILWVTGKHPPAPPCTEEQILALLLG